ncbi:MAG TPA: zinc-binding dehydrogenase [Chthoniobacterales bacterium]
MAPLFGSWATFRPIGVGSREGLQDVAQAVAMAGVKPVIDRVFEFEKAKEAFAYLDGGSQVGKVVVRL